MLFRSGNHLHFEIRVDGAHKNPANYVNIKGATGSGGTGGPDPDINDPIVKLANAVTDTNKAINNISKTNTIINKNTTVSPTLLDITEAVHGSKNLENQVYVINNTVGGVNDDKLSKLENISNGLNKICDNTKKTNDILEQILMVMDANTDNITDSGLEMTNSLSAIFKGL